MAVERLSSSVWAENKVYFIIVEGKLDFLSRSAAAFVTRGFKVGDISTSKRKAVMTSNKVKFAFVQFFFGHRICPDYDFILLKITLTLQTVHKNNEGNYMQITNAS